MSHTATEVSQDSTDLLGLARNVGEGRKTGPNGYKTRSSAVSGY